MVLYHQTVMPRDVATVWTIMVWWYMAMTTTSAPRPLHKASAVF